MILHGELVEQTVDRDLRARFLKEIVLAKGAMPIALVRKRAVRGHDPLPCRAPVLLIHGYAQNRYAFHLPSRSLANHLAHAGYDVYNVDLRGRGRSRRLGARRPKGVLDFVREDVPAALAAIAEHSGVAPVFLVGHSLGGVVSYCVAVDERPRVAGVVALGSPYHFTVGSRWLTLASRAFTALDQRVRIPNLVIPARSYGRFVHAARRLVESPLHPLPFRGFRSGSMEPEVLREHMTLAMDRGSISTMRMMFERAREVRTGCAPEAGLFGYAQRFEALDVPLLVVAGDHDDLAPAASVRPAFERSQSSDRQYRALPFGHVDLLVGREAPRLTWPLLEAWLGRRTEAALAARAA